MNQNVILKFQKYIVKDYLNLNMLFNRKVKIKKKLFVEYIFIPQIIIYCNIILFMFKCTRS